MKTAKVLAMVAAATIAFPTTGFAASIADGETVNYDVLGTASVYQIFGHSGSSGGHPPPPDGSDAVLTTFAAGSGNVFTFTASGAIGCCSAIVPGWGPDGNPGGTSIGGMNGLSNITGNAQIPLVGVFTTESDPFGGVAPTTLNFDRNAPTSLAPLLHQVFYIGDGRAGFDDAGGSQLLFTAPSDATRLYLGVVDAFSFGGTSGFYDDNPGDFDVSVSLTAAPGAVPEPATWAMMVLGFGALGGMLRASRRHRIRPARA